MQHFFDVSVLDFHDLLKVFLERGANQFQLAKRLVAFFLGNVSLDELHNLEDLLVDELDFDFLLELGADLTDQVKQKLASDLCFVEE